MAKIVKEKQVFRVFVERHYIAVDFFDIEAKSATIARKKAVKAAYKISPDPREKATDNTWITHDPTAIEIVGYPLGKKAYEMKEVLSGVWASNANKHLR